jgi:hypothetical protein
VEPAAAAAWAAASASEPEPLVPAPEPEVAPVTPPSVPTVATTIDLPARGDSAAGGAPGEGGEWALLLSKLQAWLGSGQLQAQLQAARSPLTLAAGLIALVVVVQIYAALLGVIEHSLAPGLLELVGLISVVRFGLAESVRSQERPALIEGLQQRWQAFRARPELPRLGPLIPAPALGPEARSIAWPDCISFRWTFSSAVPAPFVVPMALMKLPWCLAVAPSIPM